MRVVPLLFLVPGLVVGACALNPHPEPPEEMGDPAATSGGGGGGQGKGGSDANAGGAAGAPVNAGGASGVAGFPGAGTGGASMGTGGATGTGGANSGGGGGSSPGGAALPDSPTPYCTNESGESGPCAAAGAKSGEDGAFQGPISSFVDEGASLRDTLTQLSWQKQAAGPMPATDVPTTTCPAGFRAPSLIELLTLADFGRADGQFPPFGAGAQHFAQGPLGVAQLSLPGGPTSHAPTAPGLLRCVSGAAFVVGFTVDTGGATVSSNLGLRFEQGADPTPASWSAALELCHAKGGGARLPTVKELFTLVDEAQTPRLNTAFSSPEATGGTYWSSSADATGPRAYAVTFETGDVVSDTPDVLHLVRCIVP